MSVIEQPSPLTAGAEAAGAYQQSSEEKRRYNAEQADKAAQEAEHQSEFQQQMGLEQKRVGIEQQQADTSSRLATVQEKAQELNRIHQIFEEKREKAQDDYTKTHDQAVLKFQYRQLASSEAIAREQIKNSKSIAELQAATERADTAANNATQLSVAATYANATATREGATASAALSSLDDASTSWLSDESTKHLTMPQMLEDLNKNTALRANPKAYAALRTIIASGHAGSITGGMAGSKPTSVAQYRELLAASPGFQQLDPALQENYQTMLDKLSPSGAMTVVRSLASGQAQSKYMTQQAAQSLLQNVPQVPGETPAKPPTMGPPAPVPQAKSEIQLLLDKLIPKGSGLGNALGTQ